MSENNFSSPQPVVGQLYASDDYAWLGREFWFFDDKYRFVFIKAGQVLRSGATLYYDANFNASQCVDVTWFVNGIVPTINIYSNPTAVVWDLTSSPYASGAYALVWCGGIANLVNKPGDDTGLIGAAANQATNGVSCVYERATLVPWVNGTMHPINAYFTAQVTTVCTIGATCTAAFYGTSTANITSQLSIGDIINTSTSLYGAIAAINNANAMATTISSPGISNGAMTVNVIKSLGSVDKSFLYTVCSAGIQYTIPAIRNTSVSNICTSAATAVVFCPAGIAGYLYKVGDRVTVANQTGYSTLSITSINNSTAFTLNANTTVGVSGTMGVDIINVNCYNYVVSVKV